MDIIRELKTHRVIQTGIFTLKSGNMSKMYIDMRNVISFPHIHQEICRLLSKKINKDSTDKICGTPYGAVSYASHISIDQNIPMIFLRKETKEHGTKKMIEGEYKRGNKVVLIEDVTTTGSSIIEAAKKLESEGLVVSQIITIVSRIPNTREMYNKKVPIEYLFHINDLLNCETSNIISRKKSNICLAADVETMDELIRLIEAVGDKICILKLHTDIMKDFHSRFNENCRLLNMMKEKYDFRIWEDRKLADIGSVMQKQANIIKNWADIVTIHPLAGKKSVNCIEGIDIIFVVEMSTDDNIMNHNYRISVMDMAESCPNVIGVVSQHKVSDDLLHFVPGISLTAKRDNMGQSYSLPSTKKFADIFVVGRGIYQAEDPRKAVNDYIEFTKSINGNVSGHFE